MGSRTILIAQLAVCTVLLIAAGLLLRTVINLRTQDDPDALSERTFVALHLTFKLRDAILHWRV